MSPDKFSLQQNFAPPRVTYNIASDIAIKKDLYKSIEASPSLGLFSQNDDTGKFNGGSYRISHRDTNSILTIELTMLCPLTVKPGAMISMSSSVKLTGTINFSMKKLIARGQMTSSTFTGPGEVVLAPPNLGDISSISLSENQQWFLARDAFLACTRDIIRDYKRQGMGKAIFSGEGLFVYKISGNGVIFMSSFGAIIRKDLAEGEKYIVDNGHLLAWNMKYMLKRVSSGGIISILSSGEGLVCTFTGPGTVFLRTRSPGEFRRYLSNYVSNS